MGVFFEYIYFFQFMVPLKKLNEKIEEDAKKIISSPLITISEELKKSLSWAKVVAVALSDQ